MPRITQILDVLFANDGRAKIPISWSAERIQGLRDMANGTGMRSPLDDQLASAMLLCADGEFAVAENQVLRLLRDNGDLTKQDPETFISFMAALYVLQQFGLVAAMLADRFGFNGEFSIDAEENGPGFGRIRWEISQSGVHRFVFDAKSFQYDKTREDILGFYWGFPLYANFSYSHHREHGAIIINQMDIGYTPGLAWCSNLPDYFLVPDCIFVPTRGYAYAREALDKNRVAWEDRRDVVFWRGGTTGIPQTVGDWRSLERIKLCEIALAHGHLGFLDIGLSSIVQMPTAVTEAVSNSGLMRGFVPWEQWGQFKYHVDIDGNSSPWSNLFQRLLTGSPVLKVESSRGLNQWFYDELKPWENFVPIAPDMSDLVDKVEWLRRNDAQSKMIGEAGRQLATELTYERELGRSAHTVARCFQYIRGEANASGPFGREFTGAKTPYVQGGK